MIITVSVSRSAYPPLKSLQIMEKIDFPLLWESFYCFETFLSEIVKVITLHLKVKATLPLSQNRFASSHKSSCEVDRSISITCAVRQLGRDIVAKRQSQSHKDKDVMTCLTRHKHFQFTSGSIFFHLKEDFFSLNDSGTNFKWRSQQYSNNKQRQAEGTLLETYKTYLITSSAAISFFEQLTITLQPDSARARAIDLPIPLLPPAIMRQ